jgi:ribosomal protein S18 acetylase RimI-like enzyme
MTVQISEFANRHLQTIFGLLNKAYEGSYEFVPFDEERFFSQVRRRQMSVLVAEETDETLGIIGTHLEEHSEVDIRWLAARERSDRKIIENMLVETVEKRAKSNTVSTTIDEGSPRISDWLDRGYLLNPGWLRMSARLDRVKPLPNVAEGIRLRSLMVGEEEKLVEAMNTGFGWRRLELGTLEDWRSDDPPFNEYWIQVAEAEGKIVSAVVARPDTDYNKHLHIRRGYLGPAATLPEFRNKHLASALTVQAMNFLFEKGMNSVRLGTSEQNFSSITLLRSLGFQVDEVRKILRKRLKNA